MKDITNPSLPKLLPGRYYSHPITNSIRAPKQPAFFSCNFLLLIFFWQCKIGIGHPEHGWVSVYNPKGDK